MAERGHQPFDKTLKRMADEEPIGLLEWLTSVLGVVEQIELVAPRPKDLIDSVREVDVVWRVRLKEGTEFLLHLEFQLQLDEKRAPIGERMAGYAMRLYEREHLPITSVVIYLRRLSQTPAPGFTIPSGLGGPATLQGTYQVIKLWELPPETVLARPYPRLWPLAGLMRGATAEGMMAVAEQIAETPFTVEQKTDLIEQIVVLAGIQLAVEDIRAALRRHPVIDELLEASSIAQEWKKEATEKGRAEGLEKGRAEGLEKGRAEGLEQGLEKGRAEGLEQGLEKGRLEGLQAAVRLTLEQRFGPLQADLLGALAAADEAVLTAIPTHLGESIEQVRTRLLPAPQSGNQTT
jgi:predicted transposase YdaD